MVGDVHAGVIMVRRAERAAVAHLPVPAGAMQVDERRAWRREAAGLAAVLGAAATTGGAGEGREVAASGLRASAVVVGRLRHRHLRARAFYLGGPGGPGSTLIVQQRVWGRKGPRAATLLRSAEVQRRWHALDLPGITVPTVLGSGAGPRTVWVHEELLDGRALTREQWRECNDDVVRTFAAAHEQLGLGTRAASDLLGDGALAAVAELWDDTPPALAGQLRSAGFGRDDVVARLEVLRTGAGQVVTGLCHGDPVSGNLLRLPDGRLALLDWELAGVRPVAHDLLKVLWGTDAAAGMVAAAEHLPRPVGAVLPWPQQAALVLAAAVAAWRPRWAVAERSGRAPHLRRRVQDQALTMCRLLHA